MSVTQRRVVAAVIAVACISCATVEHGSTITQYQGRMLPAGFGAGAERLEMERRYDPTIRRYLERHGTPEYIYVASVKRVDLIYLNADMLATFTRGYSSASTASGSAPIPHSVRVAVEASQAGSSARRQPEPVPPRLAQPATIITGTCFAVGPVGQLITAAHVVAGATSLRAIMRDGTSATPDVVAVSSSTDLAFLKIDVPTPRFLSPAPPGSVTIGQRVFSIGYPAIAVLGGEPKFAEGVVSSLSGPGSDTTFMQISVPLQPGNSGGPLVSETGALAGVVIWSAEVGRFFEATGTLPQNVNWAVKSEYVSALTKSRPGRVPALSREGAIRLVEDSLCLLVAEKSGT